MCNRSTMTTRVMAEPQRRVGFPPCRRGAASWHTDKRGLTALHWAAALGFARTRVASMERVPQHVSRSAIVRICSLLLAVPAARALKNQRCSRGWTPLHSSAYGSLLEVGCVEKHKRTVRSHQLAIIWLREVAQPSAARLSYKLTQMSVFALRRTED